MQTCERSSVRRQIVASCETYLAQHGRPAQVVRMPLATWLHLCAEVGGVVKRYNDVRIEYYLRSES